MDNAIHPLPFLLFALPLITAAAWDVASYRIPNMVVAAHVAAFVLVLPFLPGLSLTSHAAGAGIGLAVGAGLFALRALGGGDAKLLASVGLWCGLDHTLEMLVLAALIGGLFGLALLLFRRLAMGVLTMLPAGVAGSATLPRLLQTGQPVPYGVAIAAAGLIIALHYPL